MIDDFEAMKKLFLSFVYMFVILSLIIIIMYYFYNDYYFYLNNLLRVFYGFYLSILEFIFDVINKSFTSYGQVWFILGWLILILGILKIILEKLKVFQKHF